MELNIDTQFVDTSVIVLALIVGWLQAGYMYRNRKVAVRKLPLFILSFATLWLLLNWVAHEIAVLTINAIRLLNGGFTYSFHFYALLLMGVVFIYLSLMQLAQIRHMVQGRLAHSRQLTKISLAIVALSVPIAPINPLGLLPVLTSVAILVTVRATKPQWEIQKEHILENMPKATAA